MGSSYHGVVLPLVLGNITSQGSKKDRCRKIRLVLSEISFPKCWFYPRTLNSRTIFENICQFMIILTKTEKTRVNEGDFVMGHGGDLHTL